MRSVLRTVTLFGLVSIVLSSAQSVVVRSQTLPWMDTSLTPEQRADLLIPQMTLEQKVQQLSNDVRPLRDRDNRPPGCRYERVARYIHRIPELRIPSVRMTNGGTGLRGGSCLPQPEATAVPSASAIGASFNPDLARQLGYVLGDEARLWGHQVLLGPLMNLVRHPYGGRNFDFPSEDPYLSGVMSVETIKGIQAQGVHSVPKHIVGNEQETDRNDGNSVIPPRALHELYLLPFEMSAKDGQMAGIMCAYNRLNGVSACSNGELLTTIMRERWGWQGYVVTDRRALHDLAPSIKAGVDWELAHETPHYYALEPKRGNSRQGPSEGIRAALENGSITIADIDQMLRRRYVQMFKFGQFETNFDATFEASPDFITNGLVAREIAEQSIVLLKNENAFLPLRTTNVQSVALIGATWFAGMAKMAPLSLNAENANVDAPYTVTPQEGLENVLRSLGSAATVTYESGGGTGTQADIDRAVALARKSDLVIVMVGDNPYETCDLSPGLPIIPPADKEFCAYRTPLPPDEAGIAAATVIVEARADREALATGEFDLPEAPRGTGTDQEALMQALTADPAIAQKMVVVLKTQGSLLMPWLDKVPALVEAWYPGQEDGTAVANVLFGLRNPSGKLPMTFGTSEREAAYSTPEQFPGVLEPGPPWAPDPVRSPRYTEDLQVGYRWYEANSVKPLFPFGFGLSYTTFGYSGLSVTRRVNGGQTVLDVTYTITNTGSRQGAEASQVYLTLPAAAEQPSKRLVGFRKVDLMPGASQQVTVTIDASASNHPLSYWVPENDAPVPGWSRGAWRTASGDYTVHVGTSSAETPLEASVSVSGSGGGAKLGDFDGDGRVDVTVFRPSDGTWYINYGSTSASFQWGDSADRPTLGDYDGDGRTDLAVYRPSGGTWHIMHSSTRAGTTIAWGNAADDVAVPGDYDGDGKTDLAVFRPSTATWLILQSATGTTATLPWGTVGDLPVPGDYNGDGKIDVAVFRPSAGTWFVSFTGGGGVEIPWGTSDDIPVPGDYDGDGATDIAVFRPSDSTWYVRSIIPGTAATVPWGAAADLPVPGDYNGDAITDIAVFRPSTATWYVLMSGSNSTFELQWGTAGDLPVLRRP